MQLDTAAVEGGWMVRLAVSLDRNEISELFLAGDRLISWPTEGMLSSGCRGPLERGGMFLSEIVGREGGLHLVYRTEESAERTAAIMRYQLRQALPEE